jgi:hypothetical protein
VQQRSPELASPTLALDLPAPAMPELGQRAPVKDLERQPARMPVQPKPARKLLSQESSWSFLDICIQENRIHFTLADQDDDAHTLIE